MLTNAAAKAAGAQSRAYKMHDQGGLFLLVRPTGTKSWQLKYRWRGREKLLTVGQFPAVNVAQARVRQAEAKLQLENGIDPSLRSSTSTEVANLKRLALAWCRHNRPTWSAAHAADVEGSLERDVFPAIGERPLEEIAPPELLQLLRAVERRGNVATAQRIRQRLAEIFAFGIAEGLCSSNPAENLGAAMKPVPPASPHPALTDIAACRELLAACEGITARATTRLASRFLALTAVRLDSVRGMRWGELEGLDGAEPIWRVPPARLKLRRAKKNEERFELLVPLSWAAVCVLRAARELVVGNRKACCPATLVFAGRTGDQPIGEGAIGELYKRAALRLAQDGRPVGKHVPHGWRASFSTIMNEHLGPEWSTAIDAALGHAKSDKVEAAYNRAQLLDRRREVLDRWGDMLTS